MEMKNTRGQLTKSLRGGTFEQVVDRGTDDHSLPARVDREASDFLLLADQLIP